MNEKHFLIFDPIISQQLTEAAKNNHLRRILKNLLDKLELLGPYAGQLLDSKLFLYELKNKHPPIRLYFKPKPHSNEIYVFEFEMKTSKKKQQKTIEKLKNKILNP